MKSIERRVSVLESKNQQTFVDRPIWCNQERRAKRILAVANYRAWTCPDNLTPEQIAWRDAKQARYEQYFAEMGEA